MISVNMLTPSELQKVIAGQVRIKRLEANLSQKSLMERLFLKNRQIFFEYDASFIKLGLELSPFKLPLKTGVTVCNEWMPIEHAAGVSKSQIQNIESALSMVRKNFSL